jgi:dTDP-4-amino-4,6-dideoxy-D-galactose acyltransferase
VSKVATGPHSGLLADDWLAEQLGVRAWRVDLGDTDHRAFDRVVRELDEEPSFAYAKVPTDRIAAVHALEDHGFRVVDMAVRLRRNGIADLPEASDGIGPAGPEDADAVADVARNAFTRSRFHLDPAIDDAVANELKAAWTRSWFSGRRGDAMVVARFDDRVVGFLQLLREGPTAVIDLIGVAETARSRGAGAAMIGVAARMMATEALEVGTQAANVDSLRFYQRLGFVVIDTAYVLHRHGGHHAHR